MISRRHFLGTGVAAVGLVTAPGGAWPSAAASPFIDLRAAPATALLMPKAAATPVWAYGGEVPGPVLRLKQGQPAYIRVNNGLTQPTSVHWHGLRIENAMDGVAGLTQDPIPPGGRFDYIFTPPDAGTYWYHPHHRSWEQMARGLYGLVVIEEAEPVAVDQDLVFIADDWRLGADGAIDDASFGQLHDWAHGGRLGNWLTINGRSTPQLTARPRARIRLRCVSTANARIMAFDFSELDGVVVALDGQPLATPLPVGDRLVLAPSQRADVVFDAPTDTGVTRTIREVSTSNPVPAATLAVTMAGDPDTGARPPLGAFRLPANPLPTTLDLAEAETLPLLMEGGAMGGLAEATFKGKTMGLRELAREQNLVWAFNGVAGLPETPLRRVTRGRTVVIDMNNDTRWPHAMHLHGHHFRVIERNGKVVADAPWRDTELLRADERAKIAFVADNPGKWLVHCHMVEHMAAGMVTWFEVI